MPASGPETGRGNPEDPDDLKNVWYIKKYKNR